MSQFWGNNDSCNFNTNGSFNYGLNSFILTPHDDKPKLLTWLSPLEPQVRHQRICNGRVDSIGDWLLESKEFKSWYDGSEKDESEKGALVCYGDPGVGKSYISSLVIDYLCEQIKGPEMAVACFYYDFASQSQVSPRNVVGSLLKQLVNGLGAIPAEIIAKFQRQTRLLGGQELRLSEILKMFPTVSSSRRIFICIDALDECVPKHRLEVLDALRTILQSSPTVRIFIMGRPHISSEVQRHLGGRSISVSIETRDDDVVTYLRARLRKDTTPEVMDTRLEEEIIESILRKISGTFRLVSLVVDAILKEITIHRRRKRLHAIGDRSGLGLGETYGTTLERIRAQDEEKAKLAMATLMWICHSERPLQVDELCHALAVEIGSTDFNIDNVPVIETLLTCCQGLVTVDKEASTVRLIHHTLKEYLSTHANLFPQAHSKMAEICLTYLNSNQTKAFPAQFLPGLSNMPFLRYCSRYWGTHAKRELSDHAKILAVELMGKCETHISSRILLGTILREYDFYVRNVFFPRLPPGVFTGLHGASFFGVVEVMNTLLGVNGSDANQRDPLGMTPLIWAVRNGHEEAVKLLLKREAVAPDFPDDNSRTPLSWAAGEGHAAILKLLLERQDVNPDRPNNGGGAPLLYAARNGHQSVVELLLQLENVNPNMADNNGDTPLLCAVAMGHQSIVELLLDRRDVNPNRPDNRGRTPLFYAALVGHEPIVKRLLDREDITPDRPDNDSGSTPLSHAARNGHQSVVELLLQSEDVNPDTPDDGGSTPLLWAASQGHQSLVKLFLGRGDVNLNRSDDEGGTPLYCAARNGHQSVVELLLQQENVNPDMVDQDGRTPLSWAATMGYPSIVKLLLDRRDVPPDRPDNDGRTPLSYAAWNGHQSVVELLLKRGNVNPDMADQDGRTPLSWAAESGYQTLVKLLLDRRDVTPDGPDNDGRTPLSCAAGNGHQSEVELLLQRGDVNPTTPDSTGDTPFLYAARTGQRSVVELLLQRGDVDPDMADNNGRTPLSWAAENS